MRNRSAMKANGIPAGVRLVLWCFLLGEKDMNYENLQQFFQRYPKVALAFSGGADSAYLLYMAKQCGADVTAYFVKSQFQPAFELEDAKHLAASLSVNLRVLSCNILAKDEIVSNPENRCYYCKQRLFSEIVAAASADGYETIVDGTNASDDVEDRPGMRALSEMKVLSPLRLCGITKTQLRAYSKEAGLATWNKPAYACLATRVPAGEQITTEKLERVEQAEDALARLGFSDFRVRYFDGSARVQLPAAQMERCITERNTVVTALKPYFDTVLLDLEAR